jgi:hypothetical protein
VFLRKPRLTMLRLSQVGQNSGLAWIVELLGSGLTIINHHTDSNLESL